MSIEFSLHELEAARLARIHAGTGEREPVRVWEIKPQPRKTPAQEEVDLQIVLSQSAGLVSAAVKHGWAKMPTPPAPVVPGAKRAGRRWTLEQRLEQGRKIVGIRRSQATRQRMSKAALSRDAATIKEAA